MTNEEIRVYLQYTKVLLAIHKVRDAEVEKALDLAIDSFEDKPKPRHYLD